MGVSLCFGEFFLDDCAQNGVLAVLHGGAGQVDRVHPLRQAAWAALPGIEEKLAKEGLKGLRFSPFIRERASGATVAERFCLSSLRLLEEEPCFNAGRGAALQEDGVPRVSASFMESKRGSFSAVMNVEGILCPSELAYQLQFEDYRVLDHRGADRLADRLGVKRENLKTPAREEAWQKRQKGRMSTVGCVVVDSTGALAASTSTGGLGNEWVGRVGDSPTVAGNYATSRVAVSCTGVGEQIINLAFAPRVALRVEDGLSLRESMERGLSETLAREFDFGAIAVAYHPKTRKVEWAAGTTTKSMFWSAYTPRGWERAEH